MYVLHRATHLFPRAFPLSSVEQLQPPRETLNTFKAGEIKAKTKQTAVGGDDSTLLTWQVLFSSDSSGLRKITSKESLVVIIYQQQQQRRSLPLEDGQQVALHKDTELAFSTGTLSLPTKSKCNLLKINWIGQRLTWQVPSWMSSEPAPHLHTSWWLCKALYKVIYTSSAHKTAIKTNDQQPRKRPI